MRLFAYRSKTRKKIIPKTVFQACKKLLHLFKKQKPLYRRAIVLLITLSLILPIFLFTLRPQTSDAAWYDDGFAYRQKFTYTHNANITSNRSVTLTVDTSTLITAGVMRSDCADTRFTDLNGKLLKYSLTDGCNTAVTTYEIIFPTTLNGINTAYMYYGNPQAKSKSINYNVANLISANYDSKNANVSAQETQVRDVFFKSDGLSMYIVGITNDTVYQYTLSTAWDVSTASYASKSFSVSSQSTHPEGLFFKSDGTKMYISSLTPVRMFQYSLSTAWDVSTASYDSVSFDPTTQDSTPEDFHFSYDGTKMYIPGDGNDTLYQYTLSTAWNLSTASYASKSFSVASQTTGPFALSLSPGGSKAYVMGNSSYLQYTLSTPFDISTASYDNVSFSISSQDSEMEGLFLKPDGTKMYTSGSLNDRIYQYSISSLQSILLDPSGGDPSITSRTSEEDGPSPSLYLNFDEATGSTNYDRTSNGNNSSISGASWQEQTQCITGSCLSFDGVDDVVTITNADSIDMDRHLTGGLTFEAWIRVNTDGESSVGQVFNKGTNTYIRFTNEGSDGKADIEASLDLATSDATATITDGLELNKWTHIAMGYTDDSDDEITIYVNGVAKGTSTNGSGAPASDSNNLLIGGPTTANYNGYIDDFKIFNRERSDTDIKTDANKIPSVRGLSTGTGDDKSFLSDGLLGYWKLDESSGNATDSSGNGFTLTNNSSTSYSSGRFGNGGWFNASSTDYFSTATTINNINTVSFWASPSATTDEFINLTSSAYITASSGTVTGTGFANSTVFINGAQNGTITAGIWNHIVVTSDISINANAFEIGRGNGSYTNGKIDDIRLYNRVLRSPEIITLYDWGPLPVGWWKMDEGTGTSAKDSSANSNTGTLNNSSWTRGKYGKAANFRGLSSSKTTYSTAGSNTYSVPSTVTTITSKSWGAGGGGGGNGSASNGGAGGGGGFSQADLSVTPGESLTTLVGGGGGGGSSNANSGDGGGGGGRTELTRSSTKLLIAAGGAGGGGGDNSSATNGGAGGPGGGATGTTGSSSGSSTGGAGGTQSAGGAGGTGGGSGATGAADSGGEGARGSGTSCASAGVTGGGGSAGSGGGAAGGNGDVTTGCAGGGGGGGGYYGGGGGGNSVTGNAGGGGGGGGSSYTTGTNTTNTAGSGSTVANNSDTDYCGSSAGNGGSSTSNGNPGCLVISYNASDYINFTPDQGPISGIQDITFAMWIKTTQTSNAYILQQRDAGGIDGEYVLTITSAGKISYFDYNFGYGFPDGTTLSNTPINDGQWHHIVFTRSGTTGTFYLDGKQDGQYTVANLKSISSSLNFAIGYDHRDSTSYFQGALDDVRVYNYARTPKQIISDMNGGHPSVGTPVGSTVGHWSMDEGYGTTAHDKSPNTNNLTLSSAAWINSGKFDKAWDGDGIRHLSRADDSDFDFAAADDFTISTWFKSDSTSNPGATEYIVNKANNTTAGYALYANTSGQICIAIDDDASWTPDVASCSSTDFYDANWHHVVGLRDTIQDKTYLYIDGVSRDSDTDTTTATLDNSLTLYLGDRDGTNNGDEFNGDLDETKIYRYALTSDEVKVEYNQGKSVVMGALSTNPDGSATNSAARAYCPPGNAEGNCAAGSDPSPVGEWKLDERTGTTANDTSGNGNSGTLTGGPLWSIGKIGQGLSFDGTNDYVSIGSTLTNFITASNATISVWLSPSGTAVSNSSSFNGNGAIADTGGFIGIYRTNISGTDNIWAYNWDGNEDRVGVSYNTNEWTYITLVHTSDTLYIYKNGVLGSSTASGNTSSLSNSLRIGQGYTSSGNYWQGGLDEVRVYNYARTPAQVAWDYNRGKPLAHYKFDECQSTTANDSSGNSYSGTITIGATGSNTSSGTCNSGTGTESWNNGTTGKFNSSLGYDGTDDYTQVTDATSLRFDSANEDFSLFSWIKRNTTGTEYIISKEDADNDGWRMQFNSSNQVLCSEDATDVTSSSSITDTNWHLIGCTIDRDGNGQVYIDGIANGTATSMGSDAMATTSNIRIGTRSYTSTNYFNGLIDDVRIYNYPLTATQIQTLYNENSALRFGPLTGAP